MAQGVRRRARLAFMPGERICPPQFRLCLSDGQPCPMPLGFRMVIRNSKGCWSRRPKAAEGCRTPRRFAFFEGGRSRAIVLECGSPLCTLHGIGGPRTALGRNADLRSAVSQTSSLHAVRRSPAAEKEPERLGEREAGRPQTCDPPRRTSGYDRPPVCVSPKGRFDVRGYVQAARNSPPLNASRCEWR